MKNPFQPTKFVSSIARPEQLPPEEGREIAFAGRSNVGKSSVINVLTQQRGLARVSKTPGRTQMINRFLVAEKRWLMDLPGYGYAKVPESMKKQWQVLLTRYIEQRQSLCGLVLIMDCRHPNTAFDTQMLNWLAPRQLPVHVVLNKADKLSNSARIKTLRDAEKFLKTLPLETSVQLFSAQKKTGLPDLQRLLSLWLNLTAHRSN